MLKRSGARAIVCVNPRHRRTRNSFGKTSLLLIIIFVIIIVTGIPAMSSSPAAGPCVKTRVKHGGAGAAVAATAINETNVRGYNTRTQTQGRTRWCAVRGGGGAKKQTG